MYTYCTTGTMPMTSFELNTLIPLFATMVVSFSTGFLVSRMFFASSLQRRQTASSSSKSNDNLAEAEEPQTRASNVTTKPSQPPPLPPDANEEEDSDSDVDDSVFDSFTGEPLKMVMVVNDSLKMGKGKIAAQCCHAALGSYLKAKPADVALWKALGQTKVCVKAESTDDLLAVEAAAKAERLPCYLVRDAGRTQIEAGSITVCALGPARVSVIDQITGGFKLL